MFYSDLFLIFISLQIKLKNVKLLTKFTKLLFEHLIIGLIVGVVTGYLLSMPPLGPTNILVISQGLRNQIKYGVAIGAGAGAMDMVYIIISYGGLALIKGLVPDSIELFFADNELLFKILLTVIGCIVVIYTGWKLTKSKTLDFNKIEESSELLDKKLNEAEDIVNHSQEKFSKIVKTDALVKKEDSLVSGFLKGAFLCVSSVTIPASWFAITGYMKSYGIIDSRFITGFTYSLGVFAGTTLWFWTLVKVISLNSHKVSPKALSKINLIVGIILILLGLFLFYKAVDFAFCTKL